MNEKMINHAAFKKMIAYKASVTGKAARNHLKMELLKTVIEAIGEKWFRLKQETRSSLEYICFLSIERGFAYACSQSVSKRYDIDSSTVRRYLCQLEKQGVIKRKWRSSVKRNSRGQAVIFFTIHPYYTKYWQSLFFSTTDAREDAQVKHAETLTESKRDAEKLASTITQPNSVKEFNKRTKESKSSEFTSDQVPGKFKQLVSCFWDDYKLIETLWSKVSIASFKYMFDKDRELTIEVGLDAVKQAVRALKEGRIRKDFPAYFYGVLMKKFNDRYNAELEAVAESLEDNEKYIRTEMIPNWH